MGNFELVSDFVINDILQPHINDNFHVVDVPGSALLVPPTPNSSSSSQRSVTIGDEVDTTDNAPSLQQYVYPKILTTGSGNAVHTPFLFTKLIALTNKDKPNVVYIGTPFFDREDKYESGTQSFRSIGCRVKRLMVAKEETTPSYEEMYRIMIDWADLIFISGGNSLFALLRWQSIGLDQLIKDSAIKGKVLSGGSAGCGCFFSSMQTDSLKPEACKLSEKVLMELSPEARLNWSFTRITCLGFIDAFCVPHIDTVGTNNVARVDIAKKMLLEANMANIVVQPPLLLSTNDDGAVVGGSAGGEQQQQHRPIYGFGVDEKSCIIYEEGKIKIWSAGKRATGMGEATCHILFINNLNEVMCIPLPYNTGEALTMEGWIDRAMRSVMALQSPLDLHVGNAVSNASHRRGCSASIDFMTLGGLNGGGGGDNDGFGENQSRQGMLISSTVKQVLRKDIRDGDLRLPSPLRRSKTTGDPLNFETLSLENSAASAVVVSPSPRPPRPPPPPSPPPSSSTSSSPPTNLPSPLLAPLGLSRVLSGGSRTSSPQHARVRSQSMNSFVDMLQTMREIPD
jgi:dipeptidase E